MKKYSLSTFLAGITVQPSSTSSVGAVFKALTSQSANIIEVQDSTGHVIASFDALGVVAASYIGTAAWSAGSAASASAYIGFGNVGDSKAVHIWTGGAANKGLNISAAASQSAALQEWKDSAGTAIGVVTASSQLKVPLLTSLTGSKATLTPNGNTGGFLVDTVNSANKGIVIKGVSSQSANPFEVQDSTGAIITNIASTGVVSSNGLKMAGYESDQSILAYQVFSG